MSAETKWTPGPWTNIDGVVTGVETRSKYAESNNRSWDLYDAAICPDGCEEEYAANARLIAAAPRLYDALDLVMREIVGEQYTGRTDLDDQIVTEAWAALKQARGETP